MGNEVHLRALALDLSSMSAENLDGAEGGFIYAKVPVVVDAHNVETVAQNVAALAKQHGVEVAHIDLDSSADSAVSRFFCVTGEHG